MALLEYLASAKPVVATNVGGIPEVITDGEQGFLVPPGDGEALAEKIRLLLDEPERAREMGRRGPPLVRERFSQEVMIRNVEALYDEVLTGS